MEMNIIIKHLRQFMNNEARSCSMDFGCIIPLFVYIMWSAPLSIRDREKAFD